MGVLGAALLKDENNVICDEYINSWLQESTAGNVFVTLHIIFVVVECAFTVLIFVQFPLSAGMFNKGNAQNIYTTVSF